MTRPPSLGITYDSIVNDSAVRHETLVDAFGSHLFWMRRYVLDRASTLVASESARNDLGRMFSRPYEHIGELGEKEQAQALRLAEVCVDAFAKELLRTLANRGVDLRLDAQHAVQFRLVMEIVDCATEEAVDEEVLNRGGRSMVDCWGRWLNRFS